MKSTIKIYRRVLIVIFLFILSGCGGSGTYYMLTSQNITPKTSPKHLPVVGVEKIVIPEYMQRENIAIMNSPTQIYYTSDRWSEDMSELLTDQMIVAIQKSFKSPQVYEYPWGLSEQPTIKIKIIISRFIAYKEYVYLDATWKITNLKSGKNHSQIFSTKVHLDSQNSAGVVQGMNIAFGSLSAGIARDLSGTP